MAQNWHKSFPSCVRVVVLLGGSDCEELVGVNHRRW